MKNFHWQAAVLAFVLTLGIAMGVIYVRRQPFYHEPLLNQIKNLDFVEEVKLEPEQKVVIISLQAVDNLAETYQALKQQINTVLGPEYRLELKDKRNGDLQEAYLAVHLLLYEAQQRGNYGEISQKIAHVLEAYHLEKHILLVDEENIYLQIQNKNAYLYEIIARRQEKEGEHA